jgi:hypothetical protein
MLLEESFLFSFLLRRLQMPKKYLVELSADERQQLRGLVTKGKGAARKIQHAQILLKADSGPGGPAWTDERIAEAYGVRTRTVERIRQRLVEHGLEDALNRRQNKRGSRGKLDGEGEAKLCMVACSQPPHGRQRWTMQLLADRLVELKVIDSISRETVRVTLKKTNSNRG